MAPIHTTALTSYTWSEGFNSASVAVFDPSREVGLRATIDLFASSLKVRKHTYGDVSHQLVSVLRYGSM